MMAYQNITGSLSPQDIQGIKVALQIIQKKLTFLITLSNDEQLSLLKMGDQGLAFVNNSVTAAQYCYGVLSRSATHSQKFKVSYLDE